MNGSLNGPLNGSLNAAYRSSLNGSSDAAYRSVAGDEESAIAAANAAAGAGAGAGGTNGPRNGSANGGHNHGDDQDEHVRGGSGRGRGRKVGGARKGGRGGGGGAYAAVSLEDGDSGALIGHGGADDGDGGFSEAVEGDALAGPARDSGERAVTNPLHGPRGSISSEEGSMDDAHGHGGGSYVTRKVTRSEAIQGAIGRTLLVTVLGLISMCVGHPLDTTYHPPSTA